MNRASQWLTAGIAITLVIPPVTANDAATHGSVSSRPMASTMSAHMAANPTTAWKTVRTTACHGYSD